jgi:hypothetical protein
MDSVEAQKLAQAAREAGWAVVADFSQLGWWLRCEAADGQEPRYARSKVDLQTLILGGAVARRSESCPPDAARVLGPVLRNAIELLVTLGDFVGNVDPRTGIDRCETIVKLRAALEAVGSS